MIARPLPVSSGAEVVRVVRALGAHRYVDSYLHVIHAFVYDACGADDAAEGLGAGVAWAGAVLEDPSLDKDSRDPRLLRHATHEELVLLLDAFWTPSARRDQVHDRLLERVLAFGIDLVPHEPFDETAEDGMHPVLIDAGWELRPLAALDPVRHRGAIEAYGEPIQYAAARFEEENAIPPRPTLHELPAIGLVELLRGVDADGDLVEPFVLWTEGDETYLDYVLRGVLKVAKVGAAP